LWKVSPPSSPPSPTPLPLYPIRKFQISPHSSDEHGHISDSGTSDAAGGCAIIGGDGLHSDHEFESSSESPSSHAQLVISLDASPAT
jgi:hypothetical protein